MRALRRLAITLIVLGGLYALAEAYTVNVAEDRLGSVVQRELDLDRKPTVSVSGFPVLIRALVSGDIGEVSFDANDVTIEGLLLRRANGRLEGLHAKDILNIRELNVSVEKGLLTAEASEAALTTFLKRNDVDVNLQIRKGIAVARATRRIFARDRTIVARGRVKIAGSEIVFTPTTISVDGERADGAQGDEARRQIRFAVDLPELPGGVRPETVELHDGFARLVAVVKAGNLRFA